MVGSSDNSIYCLDARSGNLIWKISAQKSVLASPTIYKQVVYIGASDGVFRAIDLRNGRIRWEFNGVDGFVECKAFVDDSGVYLAAGGPSFMH